MGLKARAAPGLTKEVRESLEDHVGNIIDGLGKEELRTGNFESANDNDSDEANYGFSVGYVMACADLCGMTFNAFVQQIAEEAEIIEMSEGDE